jgi:hypothetical protein
MSQEAKMKKALNLEGNSDQPTSRASRYRDFVPRDLYDGEDAIGSKNFVYEAIKSGEIPSYRIGSKTFIPQDWREQIKAAQEMA